MTDGLKLYRVTEQLTTIGFSNPTYVLARNKDEAMDKVRARLQEFFPNRTTEFVSVAMLAEEHEVIL